MPAEHQVGLRWNTQQNQNKRRWLVISVSQDAYWMDTRFNWRHNYSIQTDYEVFSSLTLFHLGGGGGGGGGNPPPWETSLNFSWTT